MRKTVFFYLILFHLAAQLSTAQEQKDEEQKEPVLTKRIVVSARRLADEGQGLDKVPANVTVITRTDVAESGAKTLQELLAFYTGVVFYDNVGNGVESTIDLRGFSEGTAMAVYVDGVRLNEPDDNRVNLELVDLETIERIEIIPGGASFTHGNGALSGTVKIYTRRGYGEPFSEVAASHGSFSSARIGARSGSQSGAHGYFLSYSFHNSDGFRENGDIRQHNFLGKYNFDAAKDYNLEISYRYSTGKFGNPGALTPEELERDRKQSPFNLVDFNETTEGTLGVRYLQSIARDTLLTIVGSRRKAEIEVLTTGRSAAVFGGFRSTSNSESNGLAAQITYDRSRSGLAHWLSAGFEVADEQFGNVGFFTDKDGNSTFEANDRTTEQNTLAIFVLGAADICNWITLSGGMRSDSIKMIFNDNLWGTTGEREFSSETGMAGLTARLTDGASAFLRYSQSFQTPTVNDLFAFPLFGSNPDLKPTSGESYEIGLRTALAGKWLMQGAVYRMDLKDEVAFVITDPLRFIGRNENVGESRRTGLDMQLSGRPMKRLSLFAGYSYTKADNLSLARELGVDSLRIPLVPEHRFSLRTNLKLGVLQLGGSLLHVGSQVLSSDNKNAGSPLNPYTLVNLRAAVDFERWTLILELLNALDKAFETRGIYSFGSTYFTPGPGRVLIASVELRY